MTGNPKIAVLTCLTPHAWIAINGLVERFGPVDILSEERQSKWTLIRNRAKRLGWLTVAGQIAFVIVLKFLDPFRVSLIETGTGNGQDWRCEGTGHLSRDLADEAGLGPTGQINEGRCGSVRRRLRRSPQL